MAADPSHTGQPAPLVGSLHLVVLKAKDLPPCDKSGLSDPYCVVSANGERLGKTGVRKKTLEPLWCEEISASLQEVEELVIEVWDWNFVSKNRLCARGSLQLHSIPNLLFGNDAGLAVKVSLQPHGTVFLWLMYEDARCLFGLDLASVCEREQRSTPHVLDKCIAFLDAHGLGQEGLYRIPGDAAVVKDLRAAFVASPEATQLSLETCTVHDVASLLKQYLKELPEGLLTEELYAEFVGAAGAAGSDGMVGVLARLLGRLPKANLATVKALLCHLRAVSDRSAENLMTPSNLGVCFGPTLLIPEDPMLALRNVKEQNIVVSALVENATELVESGAPVDAQPVAKTFVGHRIKGRERKSRARTLFEQFDTDASGQIDKDEFRRLSYFLGLYIPTDDSSVFDAIDHDASGEISWPEFNDWYRSTDAAKETKLCVSPKQQALVDEVISYFMYFDAGSTGSLSEAEFAQLHADLLRHGFLLPDCEAVRKEVDADLDGAITFNEFLSWYRREVSTA